MAITGAMRTLVDQARSEYFTFTGVITVFTLIFVVAMTLLLRWAGGERGPAVAAVLVSAVALVFGVFGATLARDRARAVMCLGLALVVAGGIDFLAFYTKTPKVAPTVFWLVLGVGFFGIFPILGLARRQGEATYSADVDAIATSAHRSVENASAPGGVLRTLMFSGAPGRRFVRSDILMADMSRRGTQAAGAMGNMALVAVFTAWADVVANSWLATAADAATPASLLSAFTGGIEEFERQLAILSPERREAALRVLFHLKLIMRLEDGGVRITSAGERVVVS